MTLSGSFFMTGRFAAACAEAGSVARFEVRGVMIGGTTPETVAAYWSAFGLGCLGLLRQSEERTAELYGKARQLGPAGQVSLLLLLARMVLIVSRDNQRARTYTDEFQPLAVAHGLSLFVLVARFNRGWLNVRDGDGEVGLTEMRAALQAMHASNQVMWSSYAHFLLADAFSFIGRIDDALASLNEGLALAERTGAAWLDAELHRSKGELLLKGPVPDPLQAEQNLQRAIDIARQQSAKLFELRAATGLASLWSAEGRRAEARDLLAPVYDRFTEGFGSIDLKEARAVLVELGEQRPSLSRA
jgi:predicted ATPase